MSLKGSRTTADYIEWSEMQTLCLKLERDKDYIFSMLIHIGSYFGLRISDTLRLRWVDILGLESADIVEGKTGKTRKIHYHIDTKELVERMFKIIQPESEEEYIFLNKFGSVISIAYINRKLKKIAKDYKINISNISTHSLRKTFGRRTYENNDRSDDALILLSQIFNHSSTAITRRYLGIRGEQIKNVYLNL